MALSLARGFSVTCRSSRVVRKATFGKDTLAMVIPISRPLRVLSSMKFVEIVQVLDLPIRRNSL
jgi:hypothetical protein